MENAIEIRGLNKQYKDFALKDVTFNVPEGAIVGFIGENGAGKTTTIKSILGIAHADGGEVSILGRTPEQQRRNASEDVGVVMDTGFFFEMLRPADISNVCARMYHNWDRGLFQEYCCRFDIPMKKPYKDFSKGMRAKLRIITALSHHPKLLILDEPTSGLDPVVRSDMLDLFLDFIQDEQHSILLSSHITSDLEKIADYIVFIHEGRIVFSMSKDDMLQQFAVLKCSKEQLPEIMEVAGAVGRRDTKFDVEILVDNAPEVRAAFPSVLCENASIDDIMTFFAKGER